MMPASNSALLVEVAKTDTTANAGFAGGDPDPLARAMDLALGLEKRSLSAVSRWDTYAIDFAWSFAPVVCDLFCLAVKACVEVQMTWFTWALPGACAGSGVAESATGPLSGESREQWMNECARSMDIATGAESIEAERAVLPYSAALDRAADPLPPAKPVALAGPLQPMERRARAAGNIA